MDTVWLLECGPSSTRNTRIAHNAGLVMIIQLDGTLLPSLFPLSLHTHTLSQQSYCFNLLLCDLWCVWICSIQPWSHTKPVIHALQLLIRPFLFDKYAIQPSPPERHNHSYCQPCIRIEMSFLIFSKSTVVFFLQWVVLLLYSRFQPYGHGKWIKPLELVFKPTPVPSPNYTLDFLQMSK